jgi:hypothetical protein
MEFRSRFESLLCLCSVCIVCFWTRKYAIKEMGDCYHSYSLFLLHSCMRVRTKTERMLITFLLGNFELYSLQHFLLFSCFLQTGCYKFTEEESQCYRHPCFSFLMSVVRYRNSDV